MAWPMCLKIVGRSRNNLVITDTVFDFILISQVIQPSMTELLRAGDQTTVQRLNATLPPSGSLEARPPSHTEGGLCPSGA